MKKIFWMILFVVVFVAGLTVGFWKKFFESKIIVESQHSAYFIQPYFYTGIEKPDMVEPLKEKIIGGIVSHHFYAEREISKLFSSWRNQNPEAVVIIGANHFNTGSADILVSKLAYETPWGLLENDKEKTNLLISAGLAKNEEEPFDLEHSISVLVGFIKYYLPQSKLVPIIVKRGSNKKEVEQLAEILSGFDNVLILASLDFSHHVDLITAEKQDLQTVEMIGNWQLDDLFDLPPEQLDNPPVLYSFLTYLEVKNAKPVNFWNNNQARLSGIFDSQDVTSYIFSSFVVGD